MKAGIRSRPLRSPLNDRSSLVVLLHGYFAQRTQLSIQTSICPQSQQLKPPGLGLVFAKKDKDIIKHINLGTLDENTDIHELTNQILTREPVHVAYKDTIQIGINKIKEELIKQNRYKLYGTTGLHLLPITNITIDNINENCATASYDRTVKVWDLETAIEIQTLEGHSNVVFSVGFNRNGSKILTGSFDKTAKLWSIKSGKTLQTFWGHTNEVVIAQFLPKEDIIVTASTDRTLRMFQTETGQELKTFAGHSGDIISVQIDCTGKFIISGSFDKTIRIWDPRIGSCTNVLCGHEAEISRCKINAHDTMVVSGSFDGRAILWDLRKMKYYKIFQGQSSKKESILDVDIKDTLISACTSEGNAYVWDSVNEEKYWELRGHQDIISKVCFNPIGNDVITCSDDHTVRIWNLSTEKSVW
ncbi:uncharacterized protein CBL_14260 [Carabus blaptoides fortunei]